MKPYLPILLGLLAVTPAWGQRITRAVLTVNDLVALPPKSLSSTPTAVGTNDVFEAMALTTGDSTPGTGLKIWRWDGASTAATNTAVNNGPLAAPYAVAAGRWIYVPIPGTGTTSTNLPWVTVPIGTGSSDDTAAVQAALNSAALLPSKVAFFPAGTNAFHPTNGVAIPDGVSLRFAPGYRFRALAHMIGNFEADEQSGRLFELGNNVTIEGSGEEHYQGRRFDSAYIATQPDPTNTWRRFAAIRGRWKTNVTIRGIQFKEALDHPVYLRNGAVALIERCGFPKSGQAIRAEKWNLITFRDNNLLDMDATENRVPPTLTVFQDCLGVRVMNNNILRPLATSGGSYVLSMINIWGSPGAWVTGNYIGPMLADSTIKSAPIVYDAGSGGGVVAWNIIAGQHNGGNAIALEGNFGSFCGYNQVLPPDPYQYDGSVLDYGIYCRSATIHSVVQPGGFLWNNPFIQQRSRTPLSGVQMQGNVIFSANIGIQANLTDSDVIQNRITGCRQEGIRIEMHVNGATTSDDFSKINTTHRHRNLRVEDNLVQFCGGSGITFAAGDNVYLRRNVVRNCDQTQVGDAAIRTVAQRTGTTTNGSTTNVIQASASLGGTALGGRYIYFPSTGQIAEIESHSGSTATLRGAGVSPAPGSGVTFAVLRGHMGRLVFDDNDVFDDQSYLARTNVVSLNPLQTYGPTTYSLFHLTTDAGEIFQPGRRLTLQGVLSGNADALIEVVAHDEGYADRVWVRPISPTNGTFATSAGTAITAGTGTVSYTDNASVPYQYENRTVLTGSGTSFLTTGQLRDNCWVGVGTNWFLVARPTTATHAWLLDKQPANFSGQSFLISTVNVVGTKTQGRAYRWEYSPLKIDWGHNRCWNNEVSPTSPQGYIDLTTAPDAIPRITSTSTVDLGYRMMRFALASGATFTDLKNAYMGAEIDIISDGNPTLDFTTGGTKLRGSTTNITPASGVLTRWKYFQDQTSDGAWHVQVIR